MKKSSYTYDDLISCANGDLFGPGNAKLPLPPMLMFDRITEISEKNGAFDKGIMNCLLYTSPSPRDRTRSRMPSSA